MTFNKPLFSDKYLSRHASSHQFTDLDLPDDDILRQKLDCIIRWKKSILNQAILQSKEEALQGDFLQQFFVDVLGYSNQKDTGKWFLETEQKTQDNKKMDGALGFFSIEKGEIHADVRVVIELKNAKTDLDKPQNRKDDKRTPVQQAFSYAPSVGGSCRWIIVSNFTEIRLYSANDSTRYQAFDILSLDNLEKFKELHFLLARRRLIAQNEESLIDKLYKNRLAEELEISKNFYREYKQARFDFFHSLKNYNPIVEPLLLLNKTQKLLDRIIFIRFCESNSIIANDTLKDLIENAKKDKFVIAKDKIVSRLNVLFAAIDVGNKPLNINKFNGGLFKEDADFNSLIMDDEILKPVLKLVDYDFKSDLDVNILGHIFEQSLSDIEELKAEISGEILDKKQGKRKKDGIYYTPDYITKYIVEEAVGGWLKDRRAELNEAALPELTEDDFKSIVLIAKGKEKGTIKHNVNIQTHIDFYQAYKQILAEIKVLDPACGSGAFLNQAFDFLYAENKRVNRILAELLYPAESSQLNILKLNEHLDIQILKNNLFGVDLNEESIEITRLSLWIKTASRSDELTTLDDNIKCGNSLIDDEKIAGNKAFVWENEFKNVMEKGGFDVVIGNPPYLRLQGLKDAHFKESLLYEKQYQSATGNYDIYVLFLEKAYKLLTKNGISSFILPHKWLISEFGTGIRKLFIEHNAVSKIDHFETHIIFDEVTTYTCITTLSKNPKEAFQFRRVNPKELKESNINYTFIDYAKLSSENWNLGEQSITNLLDKINQQPLKVSDVFEKIFQGIATSADDIYLIKGKRESDFIRGYSKQLDKEVVLESGFMKPFLKGDNVGRYINLENQYYIIFPYTLDDGKAKPIIEEDILNKFPKSYSYLKENEKLLRARENGGFDNENWFLYSRKQGVSDVEKSKIMTPDICLGSSMSYDEEGIFYHSTTVYSFIKKEEIKESYKYYLCLLNSSVLWFFLQHTGTVLRGGYFRFKTKYLMPFPLPKTPNDVSIFIKKADIMLLENKNLQQQTTAFLNFIQAELKPQKISTKLQHYYELDWNEFKSELKKAKVDLDKNFDLKKRREWQAEFETEKQKAVAIKTIIDQTDKEIDAMVYALYGLDNDEIKIIEGKK